MKIIQVNCVYKRGSTGKIVADIHNALVKKGIESIVCYGRQRRNVTSEPNVYKFCSELEGDIHNFFHRYLGVLQYGGCFFSTRRLISIIKKEKPDIVHLHCINGFCVNIYKLLKYLGKSKIKTVVTNHAEFFYTGSCGHSYDCVQWQHPTGCHKCPILREATGSRNIDNTAKAWKKMKRAFQYFDKENLIFTAVSPWVKKRLMLSPITSGFDCKVVENGLDTSIFYHKDKDTCNALREELKIPANSKIVFHATAYFTLSETSLKGGRFVYELAKMIPDVNFVVAALRYDIIDNCPNNLILMEATKNQEQLATLYSLANITLLTSKRETFSMVTAESLCCGTPVVGFKAGGPESIALSEYSEFVEYGNVEQLSIAVKAWLFNTKECQELSRKAHSLYSSTIMAENYLICYHFID